MPKAKESKKNPVNSLCEKQLIQFENYLAQMVFTISYISGRIFTIFLSGPVAQLVASLIAYPGVVGSIPAWLHIFMKIDHSHPSADSRRAVVSYKRNKSMCTDYWLTA